MDQIATTILSSGRSAVELAFLILLPVMIVMLSIMHWLDSRGWLNRVVRVTAPLLVPFGLTGLGVFALIQVSMVSFAAPIATLAIMARNGSSARHIAATLAMVLAMAQANVVFPMAATGLDVPLTLGIALLGGLIAAACCWYGFGRSLSADATQPEDTELLPDAGNNRPNLLLVIRSAGKDAWDIALGALPLLVVALVAVNLFRLTGAVDWLETLISPLLSAAGLPPQTLLLMLTKYVAGGTAMMGIAMEQSAIGAMTTNDINLLAGLLICPLDVAGVAILISAGKQVADVVKPAVLAALIGIAVRTLLHYSLFS
ncbi:nucleoside recognition family protein [Thalassolituus sp. LLYu03]|uniref:nucleoside recognition family protein n=1 Tax=Thalassolituus sp. LLYu03 TaxID=3421656 RepID=UPI003D29467F